MKTDFASCKLRRPFVMWLKQQAARRGVPLYELVEELAARGRSKPWAGPTATLGGRAVERRAIRR